jgi:flagellar protein FliS
MFTQTRSSQRSMSSMYHSVQTDTGVETATPHRLVAMLFEGFFDACSQALGHIQAGNVEQKGRSLGRATRIVDEGLKAPLDLHAGGELAKDLHDLYAYVSVRLTHANLQNDAAAVEECQRLLRPIQSAWNQIGAQVGSN